MKKRILSFLLALVMVLSIFPMTVFAEETESVNETVFADGEETELEEENEEEIQEEPESVEKTTESGEDTADPVEDETAQGEKEEDKQEATKKSVTSPFAASPLKNSGETPPTGAVAYVTDKDDNPVGEGDDFGTEEEPNKVAGYYKTLQAAINACPGDSKNPATEQTTITMVDNEYYGSNKGANIVRGKNIILDLNGKTIATYEPDANTSYTIQNTGTLIITDSSAQRDANGYEILNEDGTNSGTGKISCYADIEMVDQDIVPGYATNTIHNTQGGTLKLYAGKIINQTSSGTGLACYCVDNNSNSGPTTTFEMYGGTMESSVSGSNTIRMCMNGAAVDKPNVVHLYGGIVKGGLWLQEYNCATNACEIVLDGATLYYGLAIATGNANGQTAGVKNFDVTIKDSMIGTGVQLGDSVTFDIVEGNNNSLSVVGLKARSFKIVSGDANANSKVLGGENNGCYFMDPVAGKYIKDGWYCVTSTDEVYDKDGKQYKYKISNDPTGQVAVARVLHTDGSDPTDYSTVADAFNAATTGETVQLLMDIDSHIEAPTEKNSILDLNGKTVSTYIYADGNLTIKDSSEVKDEEGNVVTPGTGTVISDGLAIYMRKGYGTNLTIDGGTYIVPKADNIGSNAVIYDFYEGGTVTINGGTFKTNEDGVFLEEDYDGNTYYTGHYVKKLIINGGYIDTEVDVEALAVEINGGEITGEVYQHLPKNWSSSFKMTGGTVNKGVYPYCYYETVDITGGHIEGGLGVQTYYAINISNATIEEDVTITSYSYNKSYSAEVDENLNISGSTFNGDVSIEAYTNATISSGTFNGDLYIEQEYADKNVTITGGTFKGDVSLWDASGYNDAKWGGYGVASGKNLSITDGVFEGKVLTAYYADATNADYAPCITGGTFDVVNNCQIGTLYVDSKNNVYHKDTVNFIDYETIYTTVGMLTKLGYTYEVTNTSSGYVTDGNGNAFWTQELTFTKGSNTKVFYVKYNADGYTDSDRLLKSTNCKKEDYILQESPYDKLDVWQAKGKVVDSGKTEGGYHIYYGYLPTDTTVLYPGQQAVGYTVLYNGGDTFTVKPFEIKIDPETIETKLDDGSITATEGDLENNKDKESAKEAITDMMNNSAVGNFVETNIDEHTGKISETVYGDNFNISMVLEEAMKAINQEEGEGKATVTDNGEITVQVGEGDGEKRGDVDLDKQIIVSLEAAQVAIKTEEGQSGTRTTMINESTYDVTPMVTIKYTNGDGEETTVTTKIPNEAITNPITFRLPIDSKTKANFTKVYHSDDATNFKKEVVNDKAPIQTDPATGERYVELSASSFSFYTCENINALIESNVVAIRDKDGNYYGFDSLNDAITAFNEGAGTTATGVEDGKYNSTTPIYNARDIILLKDAASSDFKGKQLTLDLNGCVLSGTTTDAANVTVANSSTPKATLAAVGVYKNDVLEYVADGYYVKTTNFANDTVYVNTDPSNYTIEVITSTTTDRDSTNNDVLWEVIGGASYATEAEALAAVTAYKNTEGDGKWYLNNDFTGTAYDTEAAAKASQVKKTNTVDVYADDTVTVQVKVNGARFTAADVTLTWDDEMFTDTTSGRTLNDYPGWSKGTGDNDNTYRFTSPKGTDTYYDPGTVLGEFTFKAKYLDEETIADALKNPATFTVKNTAHPAKVIGGWGVTLEDSSTQPVPTENLKDDTAKILLMDSMVGAVEGKTGLIYKGTTIDLELLNKAYNNNKGWSAKVAGVDVDGAQIQYCVLTAEEVADGVIPGNEGHEYSDWTTGNTVPKAKDADTYTVYYRIKANGYETVEGSREVTIAKQPVTLTWTAPTGFTGSYEQFTGNYSASGFSAPTAKFSNLDGTVTTLTADEIELTSGSEGMKDVGSYVFTAVEPKNYSFTNPTANVKVNGLDITGWQLTATNAAENTPTVGVIFRDGEEYAIGRLNIAEGASIKVDTTKTSGYSDASGNEVTNVNVVYEYFEGKYYKEGDTIPEGKEIGDEIWTVTTDPTASPKYSALGEYKLRMTVTADNYEKLEQEVTFTIKNPIFKYETTEYVAGYTLILVYTNETGVTFKYDTQQMYDETVFGYRWHNTESYSKVYGIVVKGNADESKILASNADALSLGLPTGYDNTKDASICDVNNKTTAQVDLDDMTAVQSIYNVNAGNMLDMQLVLRSDVNRDKKVDTIGDVAKVMAHYLTLN